MNKNFAEKYKKALDIFYAKHKVPCNFDKDGFCYGKYKPVDFSAQTEKYPNCCCSGCFGSKAHFSPYLDISKQLKKLGFKKPFGFWTPEGCSLPREKRSKICNVFICQSARIRMSEFEKRLYDEMVAKVDEVYLELLLGEILVPEKRIKESIKWKQQKRLFLS